MWAIQIQNTEVVCTHICDRHTRCFHLLPCCFLDDDDDNDNNKETSMEGHL
jgi:hypothetical protein